MSITPLKIWIESSSKNTLLIALSYEQASYKGYEKGAFNNYVNTKRWVGGQPNVYVCLLRVGG